MQTYANISCAYELYYTYTWVWSYIIYIYITIHHICILLAWSYANSLPNWLAARCCYQHVAHAFASRTSSWSFMKSHNMSMFKAKAAKASHSDVACRMAHPVRYNLFLPCLFLRIELDFKPRSSESNLFTTWCKQQGKCGCGWVLLLLLLLLIIFFCCCRCRCGCGCGCCCCCCC